MIASAVRRITDVLRPGFGAMRGQWSDDCGMQNYEYTPAGKHELTFNVDMESPIMPATGTISKKYQRLQALTIRVACAVLSIPNL